MSDDELHNHRLKLERGYLQTTALGLRAHIDAGFQRSITLAFALDE